MMIFPPISAAFIFKDRKFKFLPSYPVNTIFYTPPFTKRQHILFSNKKKIKRFAKTPSFLKNVQNFCCIATQSFLVFCITLHTSLILMGTDIFSSISSTLSPLPYISQTSPAVLFKYTPLFSPRPDHDGGNRVLG